MWRELNCADMTPIQRNFYHLVYTIGASAVSGSSRHVYDNSMGPYPELLFAPDTFRFPCSSYPAGAIVQAFCGVVMHPSTPNVVGGHRTPDFDRSLEYDVTLLYPERFSGSRAFVISGGDRNWNTRNLMCMPEPERILFMRAHVPCYYWAE